MADRLEDLRARLVRVQEYADTFKEMFGSPCDEAEEEVAFFRDVIALVEAVRKREGEATRERDEARLQVGLLEDIKTLNRSCIEGLKAERDEARAEAAKLRDANSRMWGFTGEEE